MESTRLERIDIIRERTGLGYADALKLLMEAGDDVVEALVLFEEREKGRRAPWIGESAFEWMKELLRKGNITRVLVRRDERVLLDLPVAAGVLGAVVAPKLSALAAAAALFTGCSVELYRKDGGVEIRHFDGASGAQPSEGS